MARHHHNIDMSEGVKRLVTLADNANPCMSE